MGGYAPADAYGIDGGVFRPFKGEKSADTASRVDEDPPFHSSRIDEDEINSTNILEIWNLPKLPFAAQADFRSGHPDAVVAVRDESIERFHSSSTITEKPRSATCTDHGPDLSSESTVHTCRPAHPDEFDDPHDAVRGARSDRIRNPGSFEPDAVGPVDHGALKRSEGGHARRVHGRRT